MYLEIILIIIIAVPAFVMTGMTGKNKKPYGVVGAGTVSAGVGVLLVFVVAYLMGNSIGEYMEKAIKETVNILTENDMALEALGLGDMSQKDAAAGLTKIYSTMASLLPSVFIMMASVISYIEYNIIVRIKYRKGNQLKPFAYMRDFTLKPNDVIGWFLIYLAGYLLKAIGVGAAAALVMNINALVQAIISLQGIALIFVFFYTKKIGKIVPFLASVILWILPMGRTVLFMLGMLDLLLNMRGRINKVTEK